MSDKNGGQVKLNNLYDRQYYICLFYSRRFRKSLVKNKHNQQRRHQNISSFSRQKVRDIWV